MLAGCRALPRATATTPDWSPPCAQRGLHARWLSWDDPETLRADLVILRATWDYIDRLDEFLDWTSAVANLLNAPDVVAWNTDKRYLPTWPTPGCRPCRASSSRRASRCAYRRARWW